MSKPASLEAWKKNKRHPVTLYSGTQVVIEIPNLAALIKAGRIPNHLVEAALELQSSDTQVKVEDVLEEYEFTRLLVSETVKEPSISPEDVDDLPAEDLDLLVRFAMRVTDMDAVGHQLGGLETVDSFRDIRGLI